MSSPQRPHLPGGQPWPYGPPPQPPAHLRNKPSRGKAWLTHGGAALAALVVGAGIGSSSAGEAKAGVGPGPGVMAPRPAATVTETAQAAPAPTVTETVTAPPKPSRKAETPGAVTSFAGEGEYLVGTDIKAGTYKTAGAEGSIACYWARLKDASGESDAIIANNILEGPGRATLNKGEYFQTQRCSEWRRVG
jgi:hypothetical protein